MSLRSAMLKVANTIRGIPSKASIDVYTTAVTVRVRTWAGGRIEADGGYSDSDTVITPRPYVRELTQREIAGSGGRYTAGDVRVDGITPFHAGNAGIGYTEAQIAPVATTNGVEILYVLSGAIAGEYMRIDLATDDPIEFVLVLRRKRATP